MSDFVPPNPNADPVDAQAYIDAAVETVEAKRVKMKEEADERKRTSEEAEKARRAQEEDTGGNPPTKDTQTVQGGAGFESAKGSE